MQLLAFKIHVSKMFSKCMKCEAVHCLVELRGSALKEETPQRKVSLTAVNYRLICAIKAHDWYHSYLPCVESVLKVQSRYTVCKKSRRFVHVMKIQ